MVPPIDVRPIALLLALLVISGCSCGDDVLGKNTDANGRTCPNGDVVSMGRCHTADDCCDREMCNDSTGICYSLDACTDTMPCEDPEKVCVDNNGDGYTECVYTRCTDASECGDLTCPPDKVVACIAGGCQCGEPCQGGCPSGQGCCVPEDTCHDLPAECMGLMCPPGQFISVTSSGAWSTQQCQVVGENCHCEILPPLPYGDIGLYSAITRDNTGAMISAYNLTYGDLMFGIVGNDGQVAWDFIDGISTSTMTITGDIMGPRHGNSAPGPDVGIYTDIASDAAGHVHISYQDRDLGALKYAHGARGAPFTTYVIEGEARGDTGLFSSIALDLQDRPRIAYQFAREAAMNGARRSGLRLAFTATSAPGGPGSWQTRDIDTLDLSMLGCDERCDATEVCRSFDQACVTPDPPPTACGTTCMATERCLSGVCTAIDQLPPFRDLPNAPGLWPSLAVLPNNDLLIAYHDRGAGNLKIARIDGRDLRTGAINIVTIDGNGVNGSTDVAGLFPSLFVTPAGEIHLSYMNATRRSLIYRTLNDQLMTQSVEIVEEGALSTSGGPDGILIGADSSLVVDRTGMPRIAYQDATNGELRYARKMGNTWSILTLAGNEMPYRGSFGFYADQALDRNRENPVISTYRFFLSAPNGPDNGVEVFDGP